MSQTKTLPLEQIKVQKGFNPRGDVDTKGPEFTELLESVKQQGVLQPVVVQESGEGGFKLVAGERRYRAANMAKLSEIPVLVIDRSADAEVASITENVQRADLTPLEQARAIAKLDQRLKPADVPKALGKSAEWVRERRRLLKLTDPVAAALDSGAVHLRHARLLEQITEVSPPIAEAMAATVVAGGWENRDLDSPVDCLRNMAFRWEPPKGKAILVPATSDAADRHTGKVGVPRLLDQLPARTAKKLRAKFEALPEHPDRYAYDRDKVHFGPAQVDAARAYGCLLAFGRKGHENVLYITDPAFVAEQLDGLIDGLGEQRRQAAKRQQSSTKATAPKNATEAQKQAAKVEREKAAKERQRATDQRAAAYRRNLELGDRCRKELTSAKVNADVVALMTALAGRSGYPEHDSNGAWDARLAYTSDDLHSAEWKTTKAQEKTGATGTVKVVPDIEAAQKWVAGRRKKATTPGQIAGLFLQRIIAARFVDVRCSNNSVQPQLNGVVKTHEDEKRAHGSADKSIGRLVDKIALDLGVLPDELRRLAAGTQPKSKKGRG